MARVDILIPNYNYGRYLRQCVKSITNQGFADLRILIVDNASTDDSVAIARELMAADHRIELLAREKNQGPSASFAAGIDWAASDYFLILCSDDLIAPGFFDTLVPFMDAHPDVSFAYGIEALWVENTPYPDFADAQPLAWRLLDDHQFIRERSQPRAKPISAGAMLARTSDQKRVGHYRPELYYTDDMEMMLRLSQGRKVAETNAYMGVRRLHGANISASYWGDLQQELRETERAFESFFTHEGASMPDVVELKREVMRNFGERAYWAGVSHMVRGKTEAGSALLKTAFRMAPRTALVPPVNYLFQLDDPLGRIGARLADAFKPRRAQA